MKKDEIAWQPSRVTHARAVAVVLRAFFTALPAREVLVLTARIGAYGNKPVTYKVLAERFGVSKERIRQIENRGLRRIMVELHKHTYDEGRMETE